MNELTWPQFKRLNHIRNLTEQQQVREYRFYLDALSNERFRQNKGRRLTSATLIQDFYLLQENSDYVLQEDGSKIIY